MLPREKYKNLANFPPDEIKRHCSQNLATV